jgi:FixJ family two-component response regulator
VVDTRPVVYVVDDEPGIRDYLTQILEARGLRVVALSSAEELLGLPASERPGCLVLDVFLPGLSGLEAQKVLREAHSHLPIVFISGRGDIPMSVEAMKAGAVDFLTKPFSGEALCGAVERAMAISTDICAERALQRELEARLAALTPREAQVVRLVAAGRLNKQIAMELGIVEKTVKVHRSRGMQKLGLRTVADLVRLADRLGLSDPE